jgi:hypothetical protein
MRFRFLSFCSLLCLATFHSAFAQTTFQRQAQTAVSAGKPFSVVNLTATAEWTAGSPHESRTAQVQANADGSTGVILRALKNTACSGSYPTSQRPLENSHNHSMSR